MAQARQSQPATNGAAGASVAPRPRSPHSAPVQKRPWPASSCASRLTRSAPAGGSPPSQSATSTPDPEIETAGSAPRRRAQSASSARASPVVLPSTDDRSCNTPSRSETSQGGLLARQPVASGAGLAVRITATLGPS